MHRSKFLLLCAIWCSPVSSAFGQDAPAAETAVVAAPVAPKPAEALFVVTDDALSAKWGQPARLGKPGEVLFGALPVKETCFKTDTLSACLVAKTFESPTATPSSVVGKIATALLKRNADKDPKSIKVMMDSRVTNEGPDASWFTYREQNAGAAQHLVMVKRLGGLNYAFVRAEFTSPGAELGRAEKDRYEESDRRKAAFGAMVPKQKPFLQTEVFALASAARLGFPVAAEAAKPAETASDDVMTFDLNEVDAKPASEPAPAVAPAPTTAQTTSSL